MSQDEEERPDAEPKSDSNEGEGIRIPPPKPSQQQRIVEGQVSNNSIPPPKESQRQTVEFDDCTRRDYRFFNQPDTETDENNATDTGSYEELSKD